MTLRRLSIAVLGIFVALLAYLALAPTNDALPPPAKRTGAADQPVDAPSMAQRTNAAANPKSAPDRSSPKPSAAAQTPNADVKQAVFSGRIIAKDTQAPIIGAQLEVRQAAERFTAESDADGQFTMTFASGGLYRIDSVKAEGFVHALNAGTWTARLGEHIEGIVIQLERRPQPSGAPADTSGQIAGRVVDADGRAVEGARVRAPAVFGPVRSTTSDANGRFVIEDLGRGAHTVVASHGDRVASQPNIDVGTIDLVLTLETQGGFITGRVSSPSGDTARAFSVQLLQQVGRLELRPVLSQSFVDPEGNYRIGPVMPQNYRVRATDHISAASPYRDVEVTEGTSVVADLQLRVGASVSGVVLAADTRDPVPGAAVQLEGANYEGRQRLSQADGQFSITGILPGLFSLSASANGFNSRTVSGIRAVDGQPSGPVEILLTRLANPDDKPKRELAGIGAALRVDKDSLVVQGVIDGGGAAEAGLRAGDVITSIAGRSMAEMDFNMAIQLIRGPEGSTVLIEIRREGDTRAVDVPRKKISAG